jgi:hypothetical protein
MYQWKVGDKAVCVEGGDLCPGLGRPELQFPVQGEIYTVTKIYIENKFVSIGPKPALVLKEVPKSDGGGWIHTRFRPVVHDKAEKCEEDFMTLLKRSKNKDVQPSKKEKVRG